MKRADLHRFQRQELTVVFANGLRRTAPLSHWVGAILTGLDSTQLGKVIQRLDHLDGKGPLVMAPDPAAGIIERLDHDRQEQTEREAQARASQVSVALSR